MEKTKLKKEYVYMVNNGDMSFQDLINYWMPHLDPEADEDRWWYLSDLISLIILFYKNGGDKDMIILELPEPMSPDEERLVKVINMII